ncbi:MAG TPA: hypothetical protein VFN21_11225 [Acidimicrobiales bacterium]|nr:hypothetical protein [Acidimicrobiales bacterium]
MSEAGYSLKSANITLIDACRRAGLGTAGSGYKIWGTQGAFREDLMRHALAMEDTRQEGNERLLEAIAGLGPDPDLKGIIRVAANENADAVIGKQWFARMIALWLAAATDDQMRTEQIGNQKKLLGSLQETFVDLLEAYGREMRPPFTADMLTLAIAAEMHGIAYYCAYENDTTVSELHLPTGPDGALERWHLMGCVVEALVESFTQPIESPAATDS